MPHIKQKNSSIEDDKAYTVVITTSLVLEEDESITEHPDLFVISNADIPEDAQYLRYI